MKKTLIFLIASLLMIGCGKSGDNSNKTGAQTKLKPEVNPNDKTPKKVEKKVEKKTDAAKTDTKTDTKTEVNTNKTTDAKNDQKTETKTDTKEATGDNMIAAERSAIVKKGLTYEDKKVDGVKYSSDLVKDLYSDYGVDPTRIDAEDKKDEEGKWIGNTAIIHKYVEKHGVIYKDRLPKPGDLVFFDNTYDKDKDKEYNDLLTNIGVVIEVEKDETVHFLTNSSRKGVVRYMLNRKFATQGKIKNRNMTKTINTQLRWQSKKDKDAGKETPQFAGELFNSYGTLLDVPNRKSLTELRPKRTIPEVNRAAFVKTAAGLEGKKVDEIKYSSDLVKYLAKPYKVEPTDIPFEEKKDEEGKWLGTSAIIHKYVEKHGKIYKDGLPKPGDILFLDNTFDKNKDKEYNDLLTNIGIVLEVEKDETVHFLTSSSRKGVVRYMLNRKFAKQGKVKNRNMTKTINTQLRWQSKADKKAGKETPQFAGELFNSYGSIFK